MWRIFSNHAMTSARALVALLVHPMKKEGFDGLNPLNRKPYNPKTMKP
jgi:hypothetical protein